ncbi:type III PLP-dependent enzyme [Aestuariicella hydrocarbonica]|uniref:ornithine decarboxylase n=1 Tax=Pseudomaricurvus hydrocarbonicus TaxID=1470433 RepID=A0A9E5JT29_9GAMM|nr:type III PLP-dependent enzyme [Aestuariicella hydrocarbonica]NHO65053.1 type III PLP-dependent enzyme [Aestuariicella hydrocarbonica]
MIRLGRFDDDTLNTTFSSPAEHALPLDSPIPPHSPSPATPQCGRELSLPKDYPPQLRIDLATITRQVKAFHRALPRVTPYYAVKANPHPRILKHLQQLGMRFEIASEGELQLLQSLGIAGADVMFSNPIKTPQSTRAAERHGIQWYAFDCLEELVSLSTHAPNGRFVLRIAVDNRDSVWPLDSKFGADEDNIDRLLNYAAAHRLNVAGLAFHVGSQCKSSSSWQDAIKRCLKIFAKMKALGLTPRLLNIGGGFPTPISPAIISIETIARELQPMLEAIPQEIEVAAEPGRYVVAASGTLHCQIVRTTQRQQQSWAYLNCGFYGGLIELNEAFGFELISERPGPLGPWVIAGPTCDAIDRFTPLYQLPLASRAGDRIRIPHMGAYCTACACEFNGFPAPEIHLYDSSIQAPETAPERQQSSE